MSAFDLFRDGIEGEEVEFSRVPNGNPGFQYVLGKVMPWCGIAIYRRRADERGSYGGWRWESYAANLR